MENAGERLQGSRKLIRILPPCIRPNDDDDDNFYTIGMLFEIDFFEIFREIHQQLPRPFVKAEVVLEREEVISDGACTFKLRRQILVGKGGGGNI